MREIECNIWKRLRNIEVLHLFRWYTHLLRNILSNYWCGMHLTCKNNPVKLTGIFGRFEWRNLGEVFMRLSSDAAHPDCENRTVFWIWNCWNDVLPVLGLAGCHGRKRIWCRYADWRPNLYHQIKWVSSLVAVPSDLPLPPAYDAN